MGWLWRKLATFGGDAHFVRALCVPPNIQVGTHFYKLDLGQDYRTASKVLVPGDILASRVNGYFLSNNLIPGGFKHAMVYVGPVRGWRDPDTGYIQQPKLMPSGCSIFNTDHPRCVVHAVSDGVVCQDLLDVMNHNDYMIAFRPNYDECGSSGEHTSVAAMEEIGKPYDFNFDFSNEKTLSCTELVEWSLLKSGYKCKFPKKELRPFIFSRKYHVVLADDFADLFPLVWYSRSCLDGYIFKKTKNMTLKASLGLAIAGIA